MNQILSNPLQSDKPVSFSVIRVPFLLEPNYSETKAYEESNRDRLVKKWGGIEGWERQKYHHNLKGRGIQAGIPFFNLDRLAANTMASHRLIQHIGKTYGLHVSEAIYDLLNVYYFVDGHSLNDKPRLAEVVSNKLMELSNVDKSFSPPSTQDLFDFLSGNGGRKEIELALATLQTLGISGIPKFIIEGRTVVDGAADSDVFVQAFREIEERGSVHGGPIFGDILGIPKHVINRGSHLAEESSSATQQSQRSTV